MRPNRTLLLVVTAALVLGCGREPGFPTSPEKLRGTRRAVCYFHLNLPAQLMAGPPTYTFTGLEASTLVRSELELLLSDEVIETSLNTAEVSRWELIPEGQDAKAWVRERLFVDNPNDSLLEVALVDPHAPPDALVAVAQALANAYHQKATMERQARVEQRLHGGRVNEETARHFEDYYARLIVAASMVTSEGAEYPYPTAFAPRFDVSAARATAPDELLEPILSKFEYWDSFGTPYSIVVPFCTATFNDCRNTFSPTE